MCEGTEGPNPETNFDADFFEATSQAIAAHPPEWVCRAASGSGVEKGHSVEACAGDKTHESAVQSMPIESYNTRILTTVNDLEPPAPAIHVAPRLTISQKAPGSTTSSFDSWRGNPAMSTHSYASTTDLNMIVGNPSSRCYANAPWRAFCWMCAYIWLNSTEPWGVIKEAVQTSLELSEHAYLAFMNCGANITSTWKVMQPTL